MHAMDLESKLKLPDPAKTVESIWKFLKKTRQRLVTGAIVIPSVTGPSPDLVALERKKARLNAERRRSQGATYSPWRMLR